jgi:hypothetical protein
MLLHRNRLPFTVETVGEDLLPSAVKRVGGEIQDESGRINKMLMIILHIIRKGNMYIILGGFQLLKNRRDLLLAEI